GAFSQIVQASPHVLNAMLPMSRGLLRLCRRCRLQRGCARCRLYGSQVHGQVDGQVRCVGTRKVIWNVGCHLVAPVAWLCRRRLRPWLSDGTEHETPLSLATPGTVKDVVLITRHQYVVVWYRLQQTHLLAARHAKHLPHPCTSSPLFDALY